MFGESLAKLFSRIDHHVADNVFHIHGQPTGQLPVNMALQPCRTAIQRSRTCARALTPCLRTYATDTTPSSNDAFNAAFANVRRDDYTSNLTVPKAAPQNAGKGPAPRWRQTPSGMQAELRMNFAKKEHNKIWKVNADPKKLDEMYDRFLGPNGSKLLPDELKWLAVTHKSFDQGRRGFNDRLALMGTWTLVMPYHIRIAIWEGRFQNGI
jgi:large subunit ribosomal protein L15